MEYSPVRVNDIIRQVNQDIYLPAIQREFVWEPEFRSSGGSPSIGRSFCFSDGSYLTRCAFLKVTSSARGYCQVNRFGV